MYKPIQTIQEKKKKYRKMAIIEVIVFTALLYLALNTIFTGLEQYNYKIAKVQKWFLNDPWDAVTSAPNGIAMLLTILGLVAMCVVFIRAYLRLSHDVNTEQGSASWRPWKSFNEQFSKAKEKFGKVIDSPDDLIMSQHCRLCNDAYFHKTSVNTFVTGSTGSGKTRNFLKPNILQGNCNYIVTDPKGELLESTGLFLASHGYDVRVFDIFNKTDCNTYNPFKYIRVEEDVARLAQQLMDATNLGDDKGGGSKDPFWDQSSLCLLRACIYLLWKCGDNPEIMNGKTYTPCFASINLLLALAGAREGRTPQNATLEGSYLDDIFEALKASSPDSIPYGCIAWDQIKQNPLNPTGATIISNTTTRLNLFSIDRIRNLTSSDNINLSNFGNKKTALFLIMHPTDVTFNFLLNMMYSQLFYNIYDRGALLKYSKYIATPDDFIELFIYNSRKETKEQYEQRLVKKLDAIKHSTVIKQEKWFDIVAADGTRVSSRPTQKEALNYIKTLEQAEIKECHGCSFPFHNRFCIDEFYNVGKIPDFLHVLSTIRGYNGSIIMLLQDINQIKEMYEKSWESILGNCPFFIDLKCTDNSTAEYISKLLGKTTIAHAQLQARQTTAKANEEWATDIKSRDLLSPDEVIRLHQSFKPMILYTGGMPVLDDKYDLEKHPNYKYTSDCTHVNFDKSTYHIKDAILTREAEVISNAPHVEYLTLDILKTKFTPLPSSDDYDYTDDNDIPAELFDISDEDFA